ncbi:MULTISPECIES: LL-diaminopimelate aminotransferase [Azospirillaceae]|uniref:LL-diaminopimelate aminotransferase n=1 Tax=Azospirillaceae TaxID=2829815 RepID=UPI000B652625|nr:MULTISPECIES: LL-diaminopimelate aminotransferase [Azospirillaceae]MDG5494395.1 LL-diaminopimelate aminotransferase [Niveispirillum sp. BGYR6]SNS35390.1 alanine-synthesizing transaminase [Azospirillum sp. RU38E]SNS53756.1 alanine-synthesizing transaminase [Azospirillum sp. RU37A]
MSDAEFHRIKRLPPYVFAEVNAMKARARAAAEDIIDLGMGNPDQPTPPHIVAKLVEAVQNPKTHRYSQSRGIPGLRKAISAYYKRRFDVDIDPETEAIVTIGSKEGLANLAQAITSPGDVILVPNPSYPIHPFGFMLAGAALRHIPVNSGLDDFVPALERAIKHSVPKPTALIVSFPANPTGQTVTLDFYRPIVDLCLKHGIYILSDIAYAEIYFDGNPPPSVLQIPEARDITVEFNSLSKTYNMPGWRVGFGVGSKKLVGALAKFKSYVDYGAFTPIQVAATAALNGPQDCVLEIREMYKQRRDVLIEGLQQAGWPVVSPNASMFVWAEIPDPFKHLGSLEFAKLLMQEAKVAVSPGIGFGEYGDTHVRFGLVENTQRIRQATRNIKLFLDRVRKANAPVSPVSVSAD